MFENLLNNVKVVNPDKGYWFVRTDSGANFDAFRTQSFIGIGWNYITTQDLNNNFDHGRTIQERIAKEEKIDTRLPKGRGKVTAIYNKLMRFKNLRVGDIIIIPNEGSSFLGFGTIVEEHIYNDVNDKKCEYIKRRKVNWYSFFDFSKLDPIFYAIVKTRHAISNVKFYESYIDRTIENLFIKNDDYHFVIDIEKKDDINIESLLKLINSVNKVTESIDEQFGFIVDPSERSIKLNLQSPGKIEFIFKNGKSLALIALLLSPSLIGNVSLSDEDAQIMREIVAVNQDEINNINGTFIELEARRDRINNEE